jgi:predicted amidohydrolase YtcJ
MLTPEAYRTLGIADESGLPGGGQFERGQDGKPTGGVTGGQTAIISLFDRLPKPTPEQAVDGTRKFFTELNRLAITGVVDPGGNNLFPPDYQPLFRVWRDHQMTVRVAYTLNGQTSGKEFDELKNLTQLLPMGMGDDFLRFNGLGERITVAMNNNNRPDETVREKYYQTIRWAAERGMSLTMHWGSNSSVSLLLDLFEQVNREVPIAPLRWSIAHLGDASEATLQRMKSLGVGWTVQDAFYFGGPQTNATMPAVSLARRIGVAVGAGTDAHRVMSYNPFSALQWFVDGKNVAGGAIRGEKPSREEALRLYTLGSAWFSFDESKRGSIEVGKLADLAVLSKDYMTIPANEIGEIESVLTMVGGRVVYSVAPLPVVAAL